MYLYNNKSIFRILLVVCLLTACGTGTDDQRFTYFDIDSLINENVAFLLTAKATLHKNASIDEKKDSASFTPKDSASWAHELDIFRQIDLINKPANRTQYQVDSGLNDTNSNLHLIVYTTKADLPLKFLKLYYYKQVANLKKIETLYEDNNALYKSVRYLSLEFQSVREKNIITSYNIHGGQKMMLGDSTVFALQASIKLPD